jgi:hypothetical protein
MAKRKGTEGQATQWPKEKEQKDKQHNGQKKRNRRTSNTMAKRKGTEGQATQWLKEKGQEDKQHNVTYFFWWSVVSCYFHFLFSFDCFGNNYQKEPSCLVLPICLRKNINHLKLN